MKRLTEILAVGLAIAVAATPVFGQRGGGGGGGGGRGGYGGGAGWSGGGGGAGWSGGGARWSGGGNGASWNGSRGSWSGGSGSGWHGGGWNNGWHGGGWNNGWYRPGWGWGAGWGGSWWGPGWGWGWGPAWSGAWWGPGWGWGWGWGTWSPTVSVVVDNPVTWGSTLVESSPAPFVERPSVATPPPPGDPSYWYYCSNPAGYFPHVATCNSAWIPVIPQSGPGAPRVAR